MKKIKPIFCISAAALLLATTLPAKTRAVHGGDNPSSGSPSGGIDANNALYAADLEARLRPVLEERADFRRGGNGGLKAASAPRPDRNPSIDQRDLFAIAKVWDALSPDFRALYEKAAAIPKDFDHYVSPGGNFKIFYTTVGPDSVRSLDTIGYGAAGQPDKWRVRRSGANDVPDYVDEAAFALDSAWSMEVERFGFPKPKAAPDPSGSTARYSVVIVKSGNYGTTYPAAKSSASAQAGFASHIEVNGNWSGLEWAGTVYNKRPYDALRVTCSHEFFHSIQYSMAWTVKLDDLTLGWLEGSAVLMEEAAFPDINDYLQYLSGYFSNPRVSLLSDDGNYAYMNSILFKYLYEKGIGGGENIGIVKAVHDNNLANRNIAFHQNLTKSVSDQTGRDWAEVLNGFHAESYFTGARARPWAFISDAKRMSTWKIPAESEADASADVPAYSMGLFLYKPQPGQGDTLVLSISGQSDASAGGATWGASAVVTEGVGDSASIVPVNIDAEGRGRLTLAGWSGKGSCLLVATNAGRSERRITVKIENSDYDGTLKISHDNINTRKSNPIRIAGGGISEAAVVALNGRVIDRWSASGKAGSGGSAFRTNSNGSLEWSPAMLRKRTAPGVYFITVSSANPHTGRKNTLRRKIMLPP